MKTEILFNCVDYYLLKLELNLKFHACLFEADMR